MAWDPVQYLRFTDERLRPALDLLARIAADRPAHVVDLGCGPGNVTAVLKARWPDADVLGIDNSPAMLARASADVPGCRFAAADFFSWTADAPPDVIYSNAALHWLGGHETLLPRLLGQLAAGGTLAVQMPGMHDAPLRALQYTAAQDGPWQAALTGVASAPPILSLPAYWDMLRPLCAKLDLWETQYLHALTGPDAAAQWAAGTSLRPFLDALPADLRTAYFAAYAQAMRTAYPAQDDGTTLLPFRRVFLLAQK